MATREKKLPISKKPTTSSPVPPKEDATATTEVKNSTSDAASGEEAPQLVKNPAARANKEKTSLAKKLSANSKNTAKKLNKKPTVTVKLKAKVKKPNVVKPKQKVLKSILNNPKNAEAKKTLLKNCTKQPPKPRKPKVPKAATAATAPDKDAGTDDKSTEDNLPPPVLEPIFPIDESVDSKDSKKKLAKPPKIDNYATKTKKEAMVRKRNTKPLVKSVATTVDETIEDVMNDLCKLIKNEPEEESSQAQSSGTSKPKTKKRQTIPTLKRPRKRLTLDEVKAKVLKSGVGKVNYSKLTIGQRKLIDMLDLNVRQKCKKNSMKRRRHTIEKCQMGNGDTNVIPTSSSIFSSTPRSLSPRSKALPRVRQSIDGFKRSNPYKTRSESPARILRNGKHRKLKDIGLYEGLDIANKRRKRNCSEFSGSEMSNSKHSGNESDSSFSDISSSHGADNSETAVKSEGNALEFSANSEQDLTNFNFPEAPPLTMAVIKRSLSSEQAIEHNVINSACTELNGVEKAIKEERQQMEIAVSPSLKVPEKSLILDIMKQTFNDDKKKVVESEVQAKEKKPTKARAKKAATAKVEVPTSALYGSTKPTEKADVPTASKEAAIPQAAEEVKSPESEQPQVEEPPTEPVVMEVTEVTEVTKVNGHISEEATEPISNESNNVVVEAVVDDVVLPEQNGSTIENIEMVEEQPKIEETPENQAIKENILKALGLTSMKEALEAKEKATAMSTTSRPENYTGTLKTVIKIPNRDKKKGGMKRNSLKMTLQQKHKTKYGADYDVNGLEGAKEGPSTSWKHSGGQSSDTAGAHRKSHYSNRSNMEGSSEHTDGEAEGGQEAVKDLVIPEKASSFSIHPERLCKDVCTYCCGKFGLFDTPLHIAQIKSADRQEKILNVERHLNKDSCLCDACYRHVDRKANTPSYCSKSYRRNALVAPGPSHDHCHVLGCNKPASNILRRKWIIKMKKSICDVVNLDLDNPGLHSIPICDEHYFKLEHLMVCAMCKRRLAKNHIHYLGPETNEVNTALEAEGIPLMLTEKPVVCKLCKYFATIILKPQEERPENSASFFVEYKRRLLHYNAIVPMNEADAEEPITVPTKDRFEKEIVKTKKRKVAAKAPAASSNTSNDHQNNNNCEQQPQVVADVAATEKPSSDQNRVPSSDSTATQSRPESPSDFMVDYNTLIPSIAMDCGSDTDSRIREITSKTSTVLRKVSRAETVKQAVEISKSNMKLKNDRINDIAVQRLGSNPSISVRQLFPCEEDLPLNAHVDFGNVREKTMEGWEKCCSVIQYDMETKHLWQELQKPYGNQSSFLRHLILLEKYFRNGDLILSPNANHHSINYSDSVQQRLRAYDNIPSNASHVQPMSMLPFNKQQAQKSSSGIITSANTAMRELKEIPPSISLLNAANIPKNTPITISQLNSPPLIPPTPTPPLAKPKPAPPGLIQLHPGTSRPVAPLVTKTPHSTKIKFPITRHWRPNLIPIDPNQRSVERRPGLIQVISGGKPYHITLEDYKKMCAIKKSFELKQKRMQQENSAKKQQPQPQVTTAQSLLKPTSATTMFTSPSKSLTISKTSTPIMMRVPADDSESILEKLDKHVEKMEVKMSETKLVLPKIPKSLTVIPQTVSRKPSRPSSPILMITSKPKISNKS